MPRTGAKLQTVDRSRKKAKNKPGAATKQTRKGFLKRWLNVEPEETPQQIAEREAREAAEDREDFLAEFWNGLPPSERIRLCVKGGAIFDAIYPIKAPPLPPNIKRGTLGL